VRRLAQIRKLSSHSVDISVFPVYRPVFLWKYCAEIRPQDFLKEIHAGDASDLSTPVHRISRKIPWQQMDDFFVQSTAAGGFTGLSTCPHPLLLLLLKIIIDDINICPERSYSPI
jgi:hypothetical protein